MEERGGTEEGKEGEGMAGGGGRECVDCAERRGHESPSGWSYSVVSRILLLGACR